MGERMENGLNRHDLETDVAEGRVVSGVWRSRLQDIAVNEIPWSAVRMERRQQEARADKARHQHDVQYSADLIGQSH